MILIAGQTRSWLRAIHAPLRWPDNVALSPFLNTYRNLHNVLLNLVPLERCRLEQGHLISLPKWPFNQHFWSFALPAALSGL